MIPYGDLVKKVAAIHVSSSPFTPPAHAISGDWIPTVVDSTTHTVLSKCPVVVAFGANYATGLRNIPSQTSARVQTSPPWIEDDLKKWKLESEKHIHACATGYVVPHWNGLLPHDTAQPRIAWNCSDLLKSQDFHFVMTNASPWITRTAWSTIRDHRLEDILALLSQPHHQTDLMAYFKDLKKAVGSDSIWIGHGNAEIYGIFQYVRKQLDIENWFFTSNLSYPSLMAPKKTTTTPPLDQ